MGCPPAVDKQYTIAAFPARYRGRGRPWRDCWRGRIPAAAACRSLDGPTPRRRLSGGFGMMLERWTGIALAAIAACTAFAISQVDKLPMLDERVIFLVEVALAFGIGLFVFQYSRHSDRLIEGHVDGMELMLKRNEKAKQVRRVRASRSLYSNMQAMADMCSRLLEAADSAPGTTAPQWESLKSHVTDLHNQLEGQLGRLGRNLESSDHLDDNTYDKIRDATDIWDKKIHIDDENKIVNVLQYRAMLDMINLVLPRLKRRQELGVDAPLAQFRPAESISQSDRLAIALDRDTYPPGAVIHVSLTAAGKLPSRKVIVTILDMDLKLLARKKAAAPGRPKPAAALLRAQVGPRSRRKVPMGRGDGDNAAYTVVDMNPKGVVVDGRYIVRAACGGLISEATFGVESTPPVVQIGKPKFLMGEDMTVTVIDPVANKDGSKRDYAGASDKSKLVIDSPHGRIDGYRLEETGNSTGVFRGQIRIIGVRNDGSVMGTEIGGAHIDKTQGKGGQDGAIACGPGQPVHIRYTNEVGSGAATVLGVGVNPDVELDKKEYACLDKVDICVIAPHIAGDEEVPPAIGDSRQDCWVSISSSEGSIEGYRLTESKTKSGVFTGVVSLTGLASMGDGELSEGMQYGETGGVGPHGGRLACGADDEITVHVTSAFAEPVGASARIRQRAGMPDREEPDVG